MLTLIILLAIFGMFGRRWTYRRPMGFWHMWDMRGPWGRPPMGGGFGMHRPPMGGFGPGPGGHGPGAGRRF